MKKSECFRKAQIAVINVVDFSLSAEDKLEIIYALHSEERFNLTLEELEENRKENKENEI